MGVLLRCHSLWMYTVYQFSISTQLLGRQTISGRGSRRTMEKEEREKEFPERNTSPVSALYQATLTCQYMQWTCYLNIIAILLKRCYKLSMGSLSSRYRQSYIFRDCLWLFAMKSKLGQSQLIVTNRFGNIRYQKVGCNFRILFCFLNLLVIFYFLINLSFSWLIELTSSMKM